MTIQKGALVLSRFLQVASLPLLLNWSNVQWHDWPLLALLGLTLALSALGSTARVGAWTVAALALAVIGSSSQWALLPLALAQIGLGVLLTTQKMSPHLAISGWLIETTFLQILLSASLTQGLTVMAPVVYTLLNALLLLAVWADRLPLWVLAGLVLVGLGTGYWLQQITLTFAAAVLVVLSVLNSRRIKLTALPFCWAAILLNVMFVAIRLHG
ncbi:hypothetical protein ACFQ3L_01660 [Lacticaseibacillus jixianensis]|uniref:Uncharacterized protein n=1 Tax=Lacticaseibacillus jixianensis TaxID=2486012 RepID=A0ABW4B7H6_9LACO|nr:hypothetical protein [Lacticaseibacillus jixianensis]